MPRAEVGSTKWQANKMKSKGLQRLRWYCQACERQMRDENGFKCHVQSESHVRQMMVIGEDPRRAINDYSGQFQRDFLTLLRTAHGEKAQNLNHFYQEYIRNKEHVHMNATRWPSLTEFGKHLGREGICRVSEDEKGNGLLVAWIDNSPDALRRQAALRKKERQERGDEERELKQISAQIEKAKAERGDDGDEEAGEEARKLERRDGERVVLSLKPAAAAPPKAGGSPPLQQVDTPTTTDTTPAATTSETSPDKPANSPTPPSTDAAPSTSTTTTAPPPAATKPATTFKFGAAASKPKNVFSAKNNPLAAKKVVVKEAPKKMSEAERIMKEELERKRARESGQGGGGKRQRVAL
ncbi:uncharacterized protein K452DRAFT_235672 [Aplosporella prunicola CBS 121167]|uniref:C2H2-type domain-containing protein n=1 Tax=Aplosporella prunicola CBS 121167 TaxID=1176127 RepID=A0A6A6B027_9PEZI|nr:uncharacterized protein K452DRAFT_235672 [Aplosporella prunicola CBS 121167]KAF2137529.1 hypothetical protein K452DRAFT_235672 [Aplosporella prunicola CBS 121167]